MVTQGTERLTIEELAGRTGVTVRNIRAHQSRGLLPAPDIEGRTGYYGPEHVARLELIGEMQADGFNLQAIKRLLDVSDGSGEELLGFKRALMAPFEQAILQRVLDVGTLPPEFRDVVERYSGRDREVSLAFQVVGRIVGLMFWMFVGAVFSTIGGLIGAMIFRKDTPPAPLDIPPPA